MASLLCCYFACEVHTSTSLHFTESSDVKPHLTSLSLSRAQALTHQLGVAEQNPKLNPSSFHQCDTADLSLWRWRGALVRFLGGNLVLGSFHARFCAFSNRFAGTTVLEPLGCPPAPIVAALEIQLIGLWIFCALFGDLLFF